MSLENGMNVQTLSIIGHVPLAAARNTYTRITAEMRRRAVLNIGQGIAKTEVQLELRRRQRGGSLRLFSCSAAGWEFCPGIKVFVCRRLSMEIQYCGIRPVVLTGDGHRGTRQK